MSFDDLNQLIGDLSDAPLRAVMRAERLLDATGERIRDDARKFAPGANGGPARHYPQTITYDVTFSRGSIVAEIGPEAGGQGSLGHIFEDGTATSPPQKHMGPAFDRAVPGFVEALADIAGDLLS